MFKDRNSIIASTEEDLKIRNTTLDTLVTSPSPTAADILEFLPQNDRKVKTDKVYRFQCGGNICNEFGPTGMAVEYKAEFGKSVEEFIYPSLRDKDKEGGPSSGLKWTFRKFVNNSTISNSSGSNSVAVKEIAEKGEDHLRKNMRKKYQLDYSAKLAAIKEQEKFIASTIARETDYNAVRRDRKGVPSALNLPIEDSQSPAVLYSDLSSGKYQVRSKVEKTLVTNTTEGLQSALLRTLEETFADDPHQISAGLAAFQLQHHLKQKRDKAMNEKEKKTSAFSFPSLSSMARKESSKSIVSGLVIRQTAYRQSRINLLDESTPTAIAANTAGQTMSEEEVALRNSIEAFDLTRLARANHGTMIGLEYEDAAADSAAAVATGSTDSLGRTSNGAVQHPIHSSSSTNMLTNSVYNSTVSGSGRSDRSSYVERKRYSEDLLLVQELKSGVLPEQLLKRMPDIQNLVSLDLSFYGIGDQLGHCLGCSISSLNMLHTFGLRSNRLTSKSLHVILANMSLQNLSHLDLSMNDLRGSAIPKLCQVLSSEDCKLSSLEISDTHLGSAEMKDICKALSGEYNSTNQTSSRIRKNFKSSILELCCSKNNLNLQSCVYLCDFLSKDCCMVSWLDLSWNSLNAAAGEVLSKMLVKNNTIKTFDLSNNSLRDDGGQQIAVSLMTNKHICAINLSVNNIGGRACFVFSQTLRQHPCLEELNLNFNPLTEAGARSIFRSILRGLRCFVMMQNCTFDVENTLFNNSNPSFNSPYTLDLNKPYHLAIFHELTSIVNHNSNAAFEYISHISGDAKNPKESTISSSTRHNETTFRVGASVWNVPSSGTLKVGFSHRLSIPKESMAIDDQAFKIVLAIVLNARTETDRKNWLILLCTDAKFLTSQVQNMVNILRESRMIGPGGLSLVDIIACIWSNIIDTVNIYQFLCQNLDEQQRSSLVHILGSEKFKFNWINPTGHWRLDMANRDQRNVMLQIAALNEVESMFSESKSHRGDTSQKGNWCNFRNERYNGVEFEIDRSYVKAVPWAGVLEFDYVSTTRPLHPAPETITDTDFDKLLKSLHLSSRKRLPRSKAHVGLLELQLAVTAFYFSASDVLNIMDCYSEDDATQVKVVLILFSRIDDLFNLDVVLRHMAGTAVQEVLIRLGCLNALNPLKPALDYVLQMKYVDNRILTLKLLEMGSAESGDMLKEHPRSEVSIITLYGLLGRIVSEKMDSCLMFSYCEIGERQSPIAWNVRREYIKFFLLGTYNIDSRMYRIIQMYKELEAADMLMLGPVDLQYREYQRTLKRRKKKNKTEFTALVGDQEDHARDGGRKDEGEGGEGHLVFEDGRDSRDASPQFVSRPMSGSPLSGERPPLSGGPVSSVPSSRRASVVGDHLLLAIDYGKRKGTFTFGKSQFLAENSLDSIQSMEIIDKLHTIEGSDEDSIVMSSS